MSKESKQIFKRWIAINKQQLLVFYRQYLMEILDLPTNNNENEDPIEQVVDFKRFAMDMLIADTVDSKNHKPTLLFDPIPVIQGQIKNNEQLVAYIKNI